MMDFVSMNEVIDGYIKEKEEERRKPLVKIEGGEIVLFDYKHGTHEYNIELSRITSVSQVVRWVMHLSQKMWVTKRHLELFCLYMLKHLGVEIDGL